MVYPCTYGLDINLMYSFGLLFYLLFTKCSMLAFYIVLNNMHLASKWSNFGPLFGNIPRHHTLYTEFFDDIFLKSINSIFLLAKEGTALRK